MASSRRAASVALNSHTVGGGNNELNGESDAAIIRSNTFAAKSESDIHLVHVVEEDEDLVQRMSGSRGDFHYFIVRVVDHRVFNGAIMFVILCNTLTLGIESTFVVAAKDLTTTLNHTLAVCDAIFIGVYTIEFVLKIIARPLGYWRNSFNIFDFIILALSLFDMVASLITTSMQNTSVVRIFRVFRALRALRTASFVRGLQVLLSALVETLKSSALSVCLLLIMVIFVFDVFGIYMFGQEGMPTRDVFGDLNEATLSLLCMVTADGWTDLQTGPMDALSTTTRLYSIVFLLFGNFIFTNIFIAVIIMNIQDANDNYREEVASELAAASREKKKRILERKEQELKHMHMAIIHEQKSQFHNYDDLLKNVHDCVKEHDASPVNAGDFSLNLLWITSLLTSLDHYDNITYAQAKLYQEMALMLTECYELRHREHDELVKKRKEEQAQQAAAAMAAAAAFPGGAMHSGNMLKLFGAAMQQQHGAGGGGGGIGSRHGSRHGSLAAAGASRRAYGSFGGAATASGSVAELHHHHRHPTLTASLARVPEIP